METIDCIEPVVSNMSDEKKYVSGCPEIWQRVRK